MILKDGIDFISFVTSFVVFVCKWCVRPRVDSVDVFIFTSAAVNYLYTRRNVLRRVYVCTVLATICHMVLIMVEANFHCCICISAYACK